MYTGTLTGMLIANALYAAIVHAHAAAAVYPDRLPFRHREPFCVLSPHALDASRTGTHDPCAHIFHLGQRLSIFSPQQCFGRSWLTFSAPDQGKRLLDLLLSADRLAELSVVWSRVRSAGKLSTGLFLLITAVMLEVAAQCVRRFPAHSRAHDEQK
jgi:hypothetical protein